ncbi:uncharacterized protein LOC113478846 [Athene cunicularia]|uniref:uncharacterized protein LOC113478846 n=1 Tax=Athene cunicularia TaxID=194338 RepID=UPI000EF6AB74|nr:uncharacterized protein LOC113478846 [Athene cunicularia]
MSSLHHSVAPVSAGGREAQLSLRLRGSQRAGEQMDQAMDNVSKTERRHNKPVVAGCFGLTPTSPPLGASRRVPRPPQLTPFTPPYHQNFWRRCCRALRQMEEWKLIVLIFISSLSVWGLFMVVLPCAPNLLSVLTLGLLAACWPRSKAKGSSAEEKSCRRDGRKDPIGATSVPCEAVEGATESQTASWRKRHEGEGWESGVGGDAASARELPHRTGDVGRDGNVGAATSSELLRNQPSSSHSSDLEELATSLMGSLGVTRVCRDLLGKLKESRDSEDIRKEYATCLECRRCLTGSCPHHSEPLPERDLPTLAAILHSVDLLVHQEELQLELGMGFELVLAGETVYVWQRTHRFPKIPPERCCKKCNAPLPRSLWGSESSQALSPVLSAPGTAQGQMRAAGQDAGAPPVRDREAKGSVELQPAAQGELPPTTVPGCTLADVAQTPSAAPAEVSSAVVLAHLSVWGLFMVVLPCAPNLLSVLTLGLLAACWPRSKAKGSSAEEKSCRRDGRKDPIGATSVPCEAVEGATESQTASWRKRHEGEGWESGVGGDAASARELPHRTGDVGRDGNIGAATSSELLRNQPSSSHSSDLEELATSLMGSLGVTRVCRDLLGKLKESRDSGAPSVSQDIRKEYATCLECRRCLTGSCPHHSEPLPERDLPTLAAILHSVDLLVHQEELQLELGMGFELVLAGETVYVWQRTHRFPKIPLERCWEGAGGKQKVNRSRGTGVCPGNGPWGEEAGEEAVLEKWREGGMCSSGETASDGLPSPHYHETAVKNSEVKDNFY